MPFAASVAAATAIATASYCVTNGAHVNRAHAAANTHDEVSDPASIRPRLSTHASSARGNSSRLRLARKQKRANGLKLAV